MRVSLFLLNNIILKKDIVVALAAYIVHMIIKMFLSREELLFYKPETIQQKTIYSKLNNDVWQLKENRRKNLNQ